MSAHGGGSVVLRAECSHPPTPHPHPAVSVQVSQLRHELSMKDELLQFYTSAAEESEPESVCSTP